MAAEILIVEDDPFLADLYQGNLESSGFGVSQAHDGAEAIELIKKERFDLILLDLLLPKISGFRVLENLRNKRIGKRNCNCYVMIMSNLSQEEEVKKGLDLGANEYLVKANYTLQEIIAKIRNQLT